LHAGLLLAIPLILLGDSLRLKRVAELPYGALGGRLLCGDTDHDNLAEMIFAWTTPTPHRRTWAVWEYQPVNRYAVVFADTGTAPPYPPGVIDTGDFTPWDIGDIDGDSLTDVLGYPIMGFGNGFWFLLGTMESPDSHSYPTHLSWWDYLYRSQAAAQGPCYLGDDLDGDGRDEAYGVEAYSACNYAFENRGDNQNVLAWADTLGIGNELACGDFDLDGRKEFMAASASALGRVTMYECTGHDSYAVSWGDSVYIANGSDLFSGDDVDQDGKPEFFISFTWVRGTTLEFHLFLWETTGDNRYERAELATFTGHAYDWYALSKCGDVDADSIDEVVWSTGTDLYVFDAPANNQFELIWHWQNPTQCEVKDMCVNIHDLNGNGYCEVALSGIFGGTQGHPRYGTYVYELEAVRVVSPNGGQSIAPGDTCQIRWRVFTPPRCDSVSLFLKTDTTIYPGERFWRLDTIATGLSSTESTYSWVVPSRPSSIARIVAIAYGPGWQFDESDSAFRIVGIEEARPAPVRDWALSVSPNPAHGRAIVRYDVPRRSSVRVGLYDACGRLVQELASGERAPGLYEVVLGPNAGLLSGVRFIRLESAGLRLDRKLVVTGTR